MTDATEESRPPSSTPESDTQSAPGAGAEAESYIDLERDGPIATLVLNRPEKLNAWSWESARQISAHADRLRFDDSVRVVIVRAEGRAFCAGVDLGMPADRITGRSPAEKARNYYERFRPCPLPLAPLVDECRRCGGSVG